MYVALRLCGLVRYCSHLRRWLIYARVVIDCIRLSHSLHSLLSDLRILGYVARVRSEDRSEEEPDRHGHPALGNRGCVYSVFLGRDMGSLGRLLERVLLMFTWS